MIHGKLHREDGPAIVYPNGDVSYYLNNKYYSKEDYYKKLKELNINNNNDSH